MRSSIVTAERSCSLACGRSGQPTPQARQLVRMRPGAYAETLPHPDWRLPLSQGDPPLAFRANRSPAESSYSRDSLKGDLR